MTSVACLAFGDEARSILDLARKLRLNLMEVTPRFFFAPQLQPAWTESPLNGAFDPSADDGLFLPRCDEENARHITAASSLTNGLEPPMVLAGPQAVPDETQSTLASRERYLRSFDPTPTTHPAALQPVAVLSHSGQCTNYYHVLFSDCEHWPISSSSGWVSTSDAAREEARRLLTEASAATWKEPGGHFALLYTQASAGTVVHDVVDLTALRTRGRTELRDILLGPRGDEAEYWHAECVDPWRRRNLEPLKKWPPEIRDALPAIGRIIVGVPPDDDLLAKAAGALQADHALAQPRLTALVKRLCAGQGIAHLLPILFDICGTQQRVLDVLHAYDAVGRPSTDGRNRKPAATWRGEIRARTSDRRKRRAAHQAATLGTVYFAAEAGHESPVKIGWTDRDVAHRLSDLQTGNPRALETVVEVPGSRSLEKALHDFLAPRRRGGEWFDISRRQAVKLGKLLEAARNDTTFRQEPTDPISELAADDKRR
ncbi:MAG: GIY-YIG nuclease family protein [Polyangiaceae bacterium]